MDKGEYMVKEEYIKIDLCKDDLFCEMLKTRRAALLADVDGIEQFLNMPKTKALRKETKQLRYELRKLKDEAENLS